MCRGKTWKNESWTHFCFSVWGPADRKTICELSGELSRESSPRVTRYREAQMWIAVARRRLGRVAGVPVATLVAREARRVDLRRVNVG